MVELAALLLLGIVLAWFMFSSDKRDSASDEPPPFKPLERRVPSKELLAAFVAPQLAPLQESTARFHVEDSARDILRHLTVVLGRPDLTPHPREHLHAWRCRRDLSADWIECSREVERLVRQRLSALAAAREAELLRAERAARDCLIEQHAELVERFFEVAERKTSVLDEYGDENMDALEPELCRVLEKICAREGVDKRDIRDILELDAFRVHRAGRMRFALLRDWLRQEFLRRRADKGRMDLTSVAKMTGVEFETYVAGVLRAQGFQSVRGTPASGDQGADLLAEKHGKLIVIQAKRYTGSVGNKAVQEVIAAVVYYDGDEGWVVTNSTFTAAAKALAQKSRVRLVDGVELAKLAAGDSMDLVSNSSGDAR